MDKRGRKTLLATAKSNSAVVGEACKPVTLECRSITCRVTFPTVAHEDCAVLYHNTGAWPDLSREGLRPTSRSADGKSRTCFLVREGFVFADVLTASK
ncbi:MAG: hypothetical protein AUK47_03680 [Deltaproteobacteria bacterium CG2_30_63_29]|nr:MAG: hypothetical protein AUK47_03680 [Deltaproteobacteria bacterium CG2_30_63_29]PIV98100.1 MAG: hypothetical protein COW42_16615 [Deltaproteobacteria bacterium CG17_big_fil_post_rev_8_21_14_2_50_63_7]PJB37991.1 MAG: hypothetical protein CO108_19795 [Deltaproteobacteria bacterium CG_4_9_14_3_um_filter_63_12]